MPEATTALIHNFLSNLRPVFKANEMLEEEQNISEQLRRVISTQAEILAKQNKTSPIT